MKILITGGSGFIGSNLRTGLNVENEVFVPASGELDLLNATATKDYLDQNKFDAVINCATWNATQYSDKDKAKVLENNLRIFFNIIRAQDSFGQLINLGSGAEFSNLCYQPLMREEYFNAHIPEDQYGFSKYIINKQIANESKVINLRLFGLFGKHEDYRIRFISNAICRALHNLPITIRQDVAFDYLYINDLPEIIKKFLGIVPKHKDYNVCTGRAYRLTDLAKIILKTLDKEVPILIAKPGLGLEYSGDNSRLLSEVGEINLTSMEQSIKELCLWYEANLPCLSD